MLGPLEMFGTRRPRNISVEIGEYVRIVAGVPKVTVTAFVRAAWIATLTVLISTFN